MKIPRSEYPRPQFVRKDWLCLNGQWEFEIDNGDSGLARGLLEKKLKGRIIVPFCPESELSGVGNVDFMEAVWYRRTVKIPSAWKGRRLMLNFQAVDYDATIWVNGKEAGRHRGGFTPFSCEITALAQAGGQAEIVVRARDPKDEPKPGGKQQYACYENAGCHYTRTTGIWQTVWLEPVPEMFLKRPRITPDVANRRFVIEQPLSGNRAGFKVRATLSDSGGTIAKAECPADANFSAMLMLEIPKNRVRLWGPGQPNLYDIRIELIDESGRTVDLADSYAGLRSVTIDGKKVLINGRPVFQRQVLDQGYYPDGIMTAPTDAALKKDIELAMKAGFNAARLHQKVFEERFYYHADRLGYLVWGEFGDWGFRGKPGNDHYHQPAGAMMRQWCEVLLRDYNHPSIIGWCPLNETWQDIEDRLTMLDDVTHGLFLATKCMDVTRPVLDVSGYSHRVAEADVYDCHDYEQNPEKFAANHKGLKDGKPFLNGSPDRPISIAYCGQPYFVSEFGGIKWNPAKADNRGSWGYGQTPESLDEFHDRFDRLCAVLLDNPDMFGYCYTQLTDVFQEQNGIYRFDRGCKFDMAKIRKSLTRLAAIEKSR